MENKSTKRNKTKLASQRFDEIKIDPAIPPLLDDLITQGGKSVYIVDQMCGAGKTSAAINYINNLDDDRPILYITPYLEEVQRLKEACAEKNFVEPTISNKHGSKLYSLEQNLYNRRNIVSTHALFSMMDEKCMYAIKAFNYILIMDEVSEVIQPYYISKSDLNTMLEHYANVTDKGILEWIDEGYDGLKFRNEKLLCEQHALVYINDTILCWQFPVSIFKAFDEIWILTYMFQSQYQKYYYDLFGVQYVYKFVAGDDINNYHFVDKMPDTYQKPSDYKSLIHIVQDSNTEPSADPLHDTTYSKSWYVRAENNVNKIKKKNNEEADTIFTVMYQKLDNLIRHITKSSAKQLMWTTFEQYKNKIAVKRYRNKFVPCNARATNNYRDRIIVAYLINRYLQPFLKSYFLQNGVPVDEDGYALSELIQFIFRSALRDHKEITLYIPSIRMRTLLQNWLDDKYINSDYVTKIEPKGIQAGTAKKDEWAHYFDDVEPKALYTQYMMDPTNEGDMPKMGRFIEEAYDIRKEESRIEEF